MLGANLLESLFVLSFNHQNPQIGLIALTISPFLVIDAKTNLKGKCALGPFLSILVIECQHKCLNVNQCPWMNKVQI
jgi:hypothetical protein